jgi:hypothetical protein
MIQMTNSQLTNLQVANSSSLKLDITLLLHLCKMIGQKGTSSTGYETWIFETWQKSFVNLDVEVNERRVPSNQKSKLIHESKGYAPLETWIEKTRMDTP